LRIATEEAFITRKCSRLKRLIAEGFDDPGFVSLWGSTRFARRAHPVIERLQIWARGRLGDMDAAGSTGHHRLTAPGTHVSRPRRLDARPRGQRPILSRPAAAIRTLHRHDAIRPPRPCMVGQGKSNAATRWIQTVIQQRHVGGGTPMTKNTGRYSKPPILGTPVYLHPQGPSKGLIGPLLERGWTARCTALGWTRACTCCAYRDGRLRSIPELKFIVGTAVKHCPMALSGSTTMHAAGTARAVTSS